MPILNAIFSMVESLATIAMKFVRFVAQMIQRIANIVRSVVNAAKTIFGKAANTAMRIHIQDPVWQKVLTGHFDWYHALRGQKESDEETQKLIDGLGDKDGNGIPDQYDRDANDPSRDPLHLKFPVMPLRQNDYVRYLPRQLGALGSAMAPGAKGIVRSEEYTYGMGGGQYVIVKWNAGHIFERVNAMDLFFLGHVFNSVHRVVDYVR